jgi:hypothetical protein
MRTSRTTIWILLSLATFLAGLAVTPEAIATNALGDSCCESESPFSTSTTPATENATDDDCCETGSPDCCPVCCSTFVSVPSIVTTPGDAGGCRSAIAPEKRSVATCDAPGVYRPPRA